MFKIMQTKKAISIVNDIGICADFWLDPANHMYVEYDPPVMSTTKGEQLKEFDSFDKAKLWCAINYPGIWL